MLRPPGESPAWTWAFVLVTVDAGATRLLDRMRSNPARSTLGPSTGRPTLGRAVDYLLWEPVDFVVEGKTLEGIKRRVEGAVGMESPPAKRERRHVRVLGDRRPSGRRDAVREPFQVRRG